MYFNIFFLKSRYRMGIFWGGGCSKFEIFFLGGGGGGGACVVFPNFRKSIRCWVQAYV